MFGEMSLRSFEVGAGMRFGLATIGATALVLTAAGCDISPAEDAVPPPPPRPPCADVYNSAVNACVAASGCAGFACFYVWDLCSADAKRGPLMECCVANYPTDEARQQCIDSLGQGP